MTKLSEFSSKRLALKKPRPEGFRKSNADLAFSDPSDLEGRLWHKWEDHRSRTVVSNMRIGLIGFTGAEHRQMRDLMCAVGVMSCTSYSNVLTLERASVRSGSFTHVIVHLEAFETHLDAVIKLLVFREANPSIKLLLVSRNIQVDDFGSERNTLCDVSLKIPVSSRRLRNGLIESCI